METYSKKNNTHLERLEFVMIVLEVKLLKRCLKFLKPTIVTLNSSIKDINYLMCFLRQFSISIEVAC